VIGFVTSSPYFWGDGEIVPNFAKKCIDALICRVVVPNDATYEKGKIMFQKRDDRSIFL